MLSARVPQQCHQLTCVKCRTDDYSESIVTLSDLPLYRLVGYIVAALASYYCDRR